MNHKEWIIGYDARNVLHKDDSNVMDRKASADSSIWASVFDHGEYPALSLVERKEIGLGVIPLPEYIGDNRPLWENLYELEKHLAGLAHTIVRPYWIIAVTGLVSEIGKKIEPIDWPRFESTIPSEISKDWLLLGYDVNSRNDEDNISWLFPDKSEEQKNEQLQWVRRLNQYGLFENVKDAIEFEENEYSLTPIDAPYFVRGLWIVRKMVRPD